MGIIATIAILRPTLPVFAFGMIIPMFLAAIIWIIGDILGFYGFGEQNIGYLAHLSGALIGILSGIILKPKIKKTKTKKQKIDIPEPLIQHWEDNFIKN